MSGLSGKVSLVAGGAGEVGEGIVRVFLREGATVIVPSRKEDKLAQLRDRFGAEASERLVTRVAEIGTLDGAKETRDFVIEKFGRLDVAVASLGRWWEGAPLTGVPIETWNRILENNLTSHFIVARTFLPLVSKDQGGSYIFINGDACDIPVANSGPVSIVGAAQLMMKDVAVEELKESPVRINAIVIGTPVVTRSRTKTQRGWLTADEIGSYAAYLASDDGRHVSGESIRLNDRSQIPGLL
jgi:3-oxoacyl-[acyl-carrier protein] reductase